MRYLVVLLFSVFLACQGKLTDEQKKEMRDGMKANKIVKISEAEIVDAAFVYGRSISGEIQNQSPDLKNEQAISALQKKYNVIIFPLQPGDSLLMEIEQQLIEAYTSASGVELTDNIQKIGNDSLLYTLPIMKKQDDGSIQFIYALGIRMPKKEVILSIEKN